MRVGKKHPTHPLAPNANSINQQNVSRAKQNTARSIFEQDEMAQTSGGTSPALQQAPRSRPLSDFDTSLGIRIHALARDLAPAFYSALVQKLNHRLDVITTGYQGPKLGYGGDPNLVWLRDYDAAYVRRPNNQLCVVTPLCENPVRSGHLSTEYIPVAPPLPGQRYYRAPGQTQGRWIETKTLPLLHQWGNQVSDGEHVLVTDKLLTDNERPHSEKHLVAAGYGPRDPATILKLLSSTLDIAAQNIVVVPKMPGEKTGHVDMFIMPLGPKRFLVPQVDSHLMTTIGYAHEIELAQRVHAFLENVTEQLRSNGFVVERLPMIAPVYLQPDPQQPGGHNGVFFSPTNSLVVNSSGQRFALLPTFDPKDFPGSYQKRHREIQRLWESFFRNEGYETQLVDATELAKSYGLFRCLVAPVPA